jgi:hypothetical protein
MYKSGAKRQIFENAIEKMVTYGTSQILFSESLVRKRNIIKESLLKYYESTEEFEKCKFIKDFFEDVEKRIIPNENKNNGETNLRS